MLLVSLIGEQTIPNLLPILHLNPAENLLAHTSNEKSSLKPAQRLKKMLPVEAETSLLQVDSYHVDKICTKLEAAIGTHTETVFNLTGGTKPMSLAALEVARKHNAKCIYYQTEGVRGRDQQSVLHWYTFDHDGNLAFEKSEPLPTLLTLDMYLKVHIGDYEEEKSAQPKAGDVMESAIRSALQNVVDEIKTNVKPLGVKDQAEIDLLIRRGNNIAALEIKSGGKGSNKHALDQLTTVVAREYLGIYASRVIVTRSDDDSRSNWYKALASALRVEVIEVGSLKDNRLNDQDLRNFLLRIDQILPRRA